MWYYSLNNQPVGPVDSATINSLLQSGTINGSTLVWQEGMADWKRLSETPLAAPVPQPIQPVSQYSQPAQPYANYPVSATNPPPFYSQVKLSNLKTLFISWVIVFSITTVFSTIVSFVADYDAVVTLACIVSAFAVAAAVLLYVLLYQFWKIVQDGYATVTPGKAIGFLFIPFFNFYWAFQAFWGLSKNYNSFIDRHFSMIPGVQVKRSNPTISLTFCIVYIINFCISMVNYIASMAGEGTFYAGDTTLTVIVAAFSVIYTVIAILVFADFFQTSKSILENQLARNI